MPDWTTWQAAATAAWEWGSRLGILALVVAVAGWFLRRWIGERDKAVDRGRARVEAARPEVVPTGGAFTEGGRGSWSFSNRGPGIARDVRVSFTDSANIARVREIEPDRSRRTPPRRTPETAIDDSSFFSEAWQTPATLTVRYNDSYGNEYITELAVRQEPRAEGPFNMAPEYENPRVMPPKISKRSLREIGNR